MKRRTAFALAVAATSLPWLVVALVASVRALTMGEPYDAALREVGADLVTLALSQALGLALLLALFVGREAPTSTREALGLRPLPALSLGVALLAGIAMHFVLAESSNLLEELFPRSLESKLAFARLLRPEGLLTGTALVLALLVIAPVGEELLFRGLMLPRLTLYVGSGEALLLSAMLFGLSHFGGGAHAIVPATLAGFALGFVQRTTRSTHAAIAMHAGSNAVPLLLPAELLRVPGLNVVHEGPLHLPASLVASALLVVVVALMYLDRDVHADDA